MFVVFWPNFRTRFRYGISGSIHPLTFKIVKILSKIIFNYSKSDTSEVKVKDRVTTYIYFKLWLRPTEYTAGFTNLKSLSFFNLALVSYLPTLFAILVFCTIHWSFANSLSIDIRKVEVAIAAKMYQMNKLLDKNDLGV